MISFPKMNAITALIVVLAAMMTSNSSGHVIGWKAPQQRDSKNVLTRLREERDVGGDRDHVTDVYSSYDSYGGFPSLMDMEDSVPQMETPSCVEPSIDDLQRCVDVVENNSEVIGSQSELERQLVHLYNFTIYAPESTSAAVANDLATGAPALNEKTLCPWKYETNSDVNRYPADIPYAQCQCRNCIDPDRHELSIENLCRPVVSWKLVMKKGACVNGVYQYTEEKIPVPVACVCNRRTEL